MPNSESNALSNLIYLIIPIVFVINITTFLVFIGLSFGIRRAYINILLRLFEYVTSRSITSEKASGDREEKEATADEGRDAGGDAGGDDGGGQTSNNESFSDYRVIERNVPLTEEGLTEFYGDMLPQVREKQLLASLGPLFFLKSGVEAIVEDEVTRRFSAEMLPAWNLLTRTNAYQHLNVKLTLFWGLGFCLRYFLLLPFRVSLALVSICLLMTASFVLRLIPIKSKRRSLYAKTMSFCFRLFLRSFSAVITFHDRHNIAKSDGICVANHTSPLDAIVLSSDRPYAMVGQRQPGFIGFMQRVFGDDEEHVWFDRSEVRDRQKVAKRMRCHVEDPNKMPILIFPEGTCINNTSVMMFKKGSFEVGAVIYPAAIKYDTRFADCFWNSSKEGFVSHLFALITSWAIVADVWHLPAMHQRPSEDAIQFARRVKHEIARAGGLVELEWDGNLKRSSPKPDMKLEQKKMFSETLEVALNEAEKLDGQPRKRKQENVEAIVEKKEKPFTEQQLKKEVFAT